MFPDKRSFILGMIVAFSECVAGGCKRMAFSPPLTKADFEDLRAEAYDLIEKHGLLHYHERNEDIPEADRCEWIIIAARRETLDSYCRLRAEGHSPLRSLEPFFELLSYSQERIHTGFDAFRTYFPTEK